MAKLVRLGVVLVGALAATMALAQTSAEKEKASLAKLQKQYTVSKTSFVKKPKDGALKKKYVAATVSYGTATMTAGSLSPREKYPTALRLYREALKVDPKNAEAIKNKKMIEDIYRSMGRPIPK